jgi:glycosyltransferase involved in cell wall biosynthesis
MKLLVTGIEPPDNITSWSGTPYHLSNALRKSFDVCFLGGLYGIRASGHETIAAAHRRLGWPAYRVRSEPSVLKDFAQRLHKLINSERPDAIVSMACEPIAYLQSGLPTYLIHDSTFRQVSAIYPQFQNLCKRSRRTGESAQIRGFARATATLASSQWAKESACRDYGLPSSKVEVVPFGANLLNPPRAEDIASAIERRSRSNEVTFLFVGVDWERKGGDTATSLVESLVNRGLNVKLHIVGCSPPASTSLKPFVVYHGFLAKDDEKQAAELRTLFEAANFFIMPSKADCSPIVFCEASAFGVPSISRAVGGIPEVIKSEVTGFLLSDGLLEETIVDRIFTMCNRPEQYQEMALRARSDFEARLNWDAYARRLEEIVRAAPLSR